MSDYQKINQAKIELTDILNRNGELSFYHLASVLKGVAEALNAVPNAIFREVEGAKGEIEATVKMILKTSADLLDGYEKFQSDLSKMYDADEAMYQSIKKHRQEITAKIENLPTLPIILFPHGIEETIDLAERLAKLPDNVFDRVLKLAEAMTLKD